MSDYIEGEIFVFGSNLAGRHGAGAAKFAREKCGAAPGVGYGRTGDSYAIPTKDAELKVLPLSAVKAWCWAFIEYARANPDKQFYVTPVGTGLAGYSKDQIAPFLTMMPLNCRYASSWVEDA